MINIGIFTEFFATKYLFMAMAFLGTVKLVKLLALNRGD